ncbi:MAG: phosphatidylethanolamine N-methyltransferase family protein [Candidatus Nomurabacteria bacterium]|jgi:protein-S-isoprenylcysteine O-methyltransferase Ste14|nr:phosphatidylethanolamine N-methyltransferase family protein [Candidatus Nomurabacteria bacterium]
MTNQIIVAAFWVVFAAIYAGFALKYKNQPKPAIINKNFSEHNIIASGLALGLFFLSYPHQHPLLPIAGIALLAIGILMIFLARLALGARWCPHITAISKDQIVHKSIYRFMHNPIYIGQVLMMAGSGLALQNPLFIVPTVLLASGNYQRAKREKHFLQNLQ